MIDINVANFGSIVLMVMATFALLKVAKHMGMPALV